MDNYYQKRKIEEILQNIVAPHDRNEQILIIFDGIDEYKDGIKEFLKRVIPNLLHNKVRERLY